MTYNVNNIIPFSFRIRPQGLGFANFAKAVLFAPESELPSGFNTDTTRTYTTLTALAADFADTTQTYRAAENWLGGIPATNEITVYAVDDADATWTATLNKARASLWWFWSFFTAPVYASASDVEAIAAWSEVNAAFFVNCQTGASATEIRDPNDSDTIANTLTTSGYRFSHTCAHATDAYAGISLAKWFASVNYANPTSTITGEYKKLTGVAAESLGDDAYTQMNSAAKKVGFYTQIDLQGSSDSGRYINSITHSSFGEYIDDVVNLSAFTNALQVSNFNTVANAIGKLGQNIAGQQAIITAARAVCELYIANGYLGPREYVNPETGLNDFTAGYEILTKPEDILVLSESDRNERKAASLRVRIFRAGAIHEAPVDIEVF